MEPILPSLTRFEDEQHQLHWKFREYLRGKSVAIVGRAGKLDQMEQGKKIDSHDVVVRVNRTVPYRKGYYDEERGKGEMGYIDQEWLKRYPIFEHSFVPQDWHSRIGRRTNIYYHRLRMENEETIKEYIRKFELEGGRFICLNVQGQAHWGHRLVDYYADVRYINVGLYVQVAKLVGAYPLSGTVAIADILRHNVTEAYITGFPCMFDLDIDKEACQALNPFPDDLRWLSGLRGAGRVECDSHMIELFEKYV